MEKVIDGVWWIRGQDGFLPDSHVYVIGTPGSGEAALVDCGLMDMGSYKLEELEQNGFRPNQIKHIIMTHTHLDHIGCLPEIRKALPDAELIVHKDEAAYLERGDNRVVFGNSMFQSMIASQYRIPEGQYTMNVDRKLEGGETLTIDGLSFEVIHIPGHSTGHIGLLNKEHRMFLSGDTIYADGAIGRYDLHSANPGELLDSLNRIAKLDIDILLPCHNRIVKSDAGPMIESTVRQWAPMLGG